MNITQTERVLHYCPRHFTWKAPRKTSRLLQKAFDRYSKIIFEQSMPLHVDEHNNVDESKDRSANTHFQREFVSEIMRKQNAIKAVEVYVDSSDQSLGLDISETYTIRVDAPTTIITSTTVFGAIRALETLAQLSSTMKMDNDILDYMDDYGWDNNIDDTKEVEKSHKKHHKKKKRKKRKKRHHHKKMIVINESIIYDTPRFRWRGLLLDTARHYLPANVIKKHLDAMAMSKLNVLHWHIIDDESFPLVLEKNPGLSKKGAFSRDQVYTHSIIKEIVQYARERGIRVVPEFDTPGHMRSWGQSHPEILTQCFSHGKPMEIPGPGNPAKNATYQLIWQLLHESSSWFPDTFVHLGGDEVDEGCWQSNPGVKSWAKDQHIKTSRIQSYHTEKVIELANASGKLPVIWEEAAQGMGSDLPKDTVVQVWRWDKKLGTRVPLRAERNSPTEVMRRKILFDNNGLIKGISPFVLDGTKEMRNRADGKEVVRGLNSHKDEYWKKTLKSVTKSHQAILSAPWYLNNVEPVENAWELLWSVDPLDFSTDAVQRENLLGGTACMWGELVDETNSIPKTWPLASAVAERLWNNDVSDDIPSTRKRLEQHRCRMVSRDIPASPIGPGTCSFP